MSVISAVDRKGLSKILNIIYILYVIYYSTQKGVVQNTEHHIHIICHILFYTERDCPKYWTSYTYYMSYIILYRKGLSKILNIIYILYVIYYSTQKGVVQNTEHHIPVICHILFYTERGYPKNWTTQTHYISNIILHGNGLTRKLKITYILYIRYYSTQKVIVRKTKHHIHIIYIAYSILSYIYMSQKLLLLNEYVYIVFLVTFFKVD